MKNQCIKVLNVEHGKKVIKYFKSLGVDTGDLIGCSVGEYYGLFHGLFCYMSKPDNSEVIELPTKESEFKRGDKVFVWNDDKDKIVDAIFLGYIKDALYPYIAKDSKEDKAFFHHAWKNCKQIIPQVVELTLQDISDGKGVGVDPKLIKIILT
jgi:hypothetical protein